MSSFEEWWYSTQFDKEYWDKHKYNHITEYEWAKAGFKAGMLRALDIAEDVEEGCGYGCPNIIADAIRKEIINDI